MKQNVKSIALENVWVFFQSHFSKSNFDLIDTNQVSTCSLLCKLFGEKKLFKIHVNIYSMEQTCTCIIHASLNLMVILFAICKSITLCNGRRKLDTSCFFMGFALTLERRDDFIILHCPFILKRLTLGFLITLNAKNFNIILYLMNKTSVKS